MKLTIAIPAFLVATAIGIFYFIQHNRAAEAAVWRDLHSSVPTQPLAPAEAEINDGPLSARRTLDQNEVGSIRLANGETWRFAYRSHHLLSGADSFSVFTGPPGTFRVRGDYFCCEVQLSDDAASKDSKQFLAFLRRVHSSVESAE